jgi:hypothetical protein
VATNYASNVFVNCPFDDQYQPILRAIIFAIFDCGFVPRCALELDDGGDIRFDKIQRLIAESKFGVHDISRTELDAATGLPRFNMPLELGVFLAARRFGQKQQKQKSCLILDRERWRYRTFISDIAGHDIYGHDDNPATAIRRVRDWLNTGSGRRSIPGGTAIAGRFAEFGLALPHICADVEIQLDELTYNDYTQMVSNWLRA